MRILAELLPRFKLTDYSRLFWVFDVTHYAGSPLILRVTLPIVFPSSGSEADHTCLGYWNFVHENFIDDFTFEFSR